MLKAEYCYKDDILAGQEIGYHESGSLKHEATWTEHPRDFEPAGKVIEYYENGQVEYEYIYEDGKS